MAGCERRARVVRPFLVVMVGLLAVAGCGGDNGTVAPPTPTPTATTSPDVEPTQPPPELSESRLRVTTPDNWVQGMLFMVTEEQGYFVEEGLEAEWVPIATGPEAIAALVGGSIEIGGPSAAAAFAAINTGESGIKAIAATTAGDYQLVISRAWADEHGIEESMSPSEIVPLLEGATFGATTRSGVTSALARAVLLGYGLDPATDATIEFLNEPAALLANFEQGRIDAFCYPSDLAAIAQERTDAVLVPIRELEEIPTLQANLAEVLVASEAFIADHPDTLEAFLRAMWRGWEFLRDNRDATYDIMKDRYPEMIDASFDAAWSYYAQGGIYITETGFDASLEIINAVRDEPLTNITFDMAADTSLQEQAVADLGITPPGA